MSTRLIRDGLLESEAVLSLPPEGRWLYVSIMLSADDYGLFEATPFKLAKRGDVKREHVPGLLDAMVDVDLVRIYRPDTRSMRSFGLVTKFGQRFRSARSKCPLPPLSLVHDQGDDYVNQFNDLRLRMSATRGELRAHDRDSRPETETETETNTVLSTEPMLSSPSPSATGRVDAAGAAPTRAAAPRCPIDDLIALWHEHCAPPLPAVGVLNDARNTAVATRWREVCAESGFDRAGGIDWFRWLLVERVAASAFLMGRGKARRDGGNAFRCTWDWLMRPTNFAKVVDGNYLDGKGAQR